MSIAPTESARLAHLLRRAGLGARPAEWSAYAALGVNGSTEQLLNPEGQPDHLKDLLSEIDGDFVDFDEINSVKQWWLYRMVHTQRPLEEKMTLFWHNHFATANYKVDSPRRMWAQNETFRTYGLGSFRTLLQKVARDPAMLVWLDGDANRIGKPNENFGREVMELFTMGVNGGYTEKDVQEAARSYTGWRIANTPSGFAFDPGLHDDGAKTVLGHTGNWHTDDVLDILVHHPSTAKFLTTKMFRYFVHDDPSAADIKRLTDVYYASGFDIRSVLRSMFTSTEFYSDRARFANIKSPVEFAVMTIRDLDAPMSAASQLANSLSLMGQDLFNPPNVKGWAGGRNWINTRTLLARVNFASTLTGEMSRSVSLMDRLRGFSEETTGKAAPTVAPPIAPTMMSSDAMSAPGGAPVPAGHGTSAAAGTTMGKTTMGNTTMENSTMGAADTMMGAGDTMIGTGDTMMSDGAGHPALRPSAPITPEAAVDTVWNALMTGMPMPPDTRQEMLAYVGTGPHVNLASRLPGLLDLVVALPEYQLC